jgi:hypothetical protein
MASVPPLISRTRRGPASDRAPSFTMSAAALTTANPSTYANTTGPAGHLVLRQTDLGGDTSGLVSGGVAVSVKSSSAR